MSLMGSLKKEGLRRNLSPRTIETYCYCVEKFLRICRKKLNTITKADVENHVKHMIKWNKSPNTINVQINALKFFFEKVLKKKLTINVEHTIVRKSLPEYLTKEETSNLFEAISNRKHQLMIKFLYATGMRVMELASLRVRNFEFNDNYGWVRQGKGRKDRLFVIASKLKGELLDWVKENDLSSGDWLFPGHKSKHVSPSTIRNIIKTATKKAKITKNVHPHTLRHSFATHLIQNGYAVTEVQPLLGHSKMETTMIYLHMASPNLLKVKSPYDTL